MLDEEYSQEEVYTNLNNGIWRRRTLLEMKGTEICGQVTLGPYRWVRLFTLAQNHTACCNKHTQSNPSLKLSVTVW